MTGKEVGTAAVWWEEEHTPPGARTGATYHRRTEALGRRDASTTLAATMRPSTPSSTLSAGSSRPSTTGRSGRRYTIFSDSAAAIDRITTDRLGPGQRLAIEAIDTCTRLLGRDNAVTVRWTPAHLVVESNEMANLYAKEAAESTAHAVDRAYLRETNFDMASHHWDGDWGPGQVGRRPRPAASGVSATGGGKAPVGARAWTQGRCWPVLPAPFGACGHLCSQM